MDGRLRLLKTRFWSLVMPVLIGLVIIILAGMGIIYLQQQREQRSLDDQIAQLTRVVSNSSQISDDLSEQCEEIGQAIPVELKTETVILEVLAIAEAMGFDTSLESGDIQKIVSGKPRDETIGNTTYQVLAFDMAVSGEYEKVEDLVLAMDSTAALKTLVIEELDIRRTNQDEATAAISFAVYTLKG